MAAEVNFSELVSRWAKEGPSAGRVIHLLEAAGAVANAAQAGVGAMIKGTFMEQDLRDALGLKSGEAINFRNRAGQGKPHAP